MLQEKHYKLTCPICGKEIPSHRRLFCSKKCSVIAANRAWKNRGKTGDSQVPLCQMCGTPITGRRAKYCEKCRSKHVILAQREKRRHYQKRPVNSRVATCVICGKEFETNRKNRITCSAECSYKRQLEVNKKHKQIEKNLDSIYVLNNDRQIKTCLKCDRKFISNGNRICPRCTAENENICNGSEIGLWNGYGITAAL